MNVKSAHSALLIFLFSMLVIASCKKDMKNEDQNNNPTPGNPFAIPAATPVTGSVTGIVVDENNNPVDAADIKLGALTAITDASGLFNFNHVTLDKYITTVSVTKTGYFKSYRTFSANPTRNYVSIKLIPKTLSGSFAGNATGTMTLSNGTGLSFQANSVVIQSTGTAYSGTVNVYARYIDPTSADISAVVPGGFIGKDATNLYCLQSTGMIAVELESASGQPLQLVSGFPATIQLPIPSSLQSKAPSTIDTWSLNNQGIWVKEGTATKSGNNYQMQVSHFSFWNCDQPANTIYLNLHMQDQNNNALVNNGVELTVTNNNSSWGSSGGITDSLGNVSGLVPAALDLELQLYSNAFICPTPLYTQTIGPFTSNSTQTVTATLATQDVLTITGTATTCNSQPLQNGTAIIYAGQYEYRYVPVTNGTYAASLAHCDPIASINVTVFDNSNATQGTSGNVAVSGNSITIPVISTCGAAPTSVFDFVTSSANCQIQSINGIYMLNTPLTAANTVLMMVDVTTPGTYNITTNSNNGISFSASGTFTNIGQQTVTLIGTGTPLLADTRTYHTQAAGTSGCDFEVTVIWTPAVIDMSTCTMRFVGLGYTVGTPLTMNHNISASFNVISPGTYSINTNTVNGMSFSYSGTILAAGQPGLILEGTGTPTNAGPSTFTITSPNGSGSGCDITVNVMPVSTAVYSFHGTPASCSLATVSGNYNVGVPLDATNTVTLNVDVTTPGTYNICTDMEDGIYFSASGTFTTAGAQTVVLTGHGTPEYVILTSFQPFDGATSNCDFGFQVN